MGGRKRRNTNRRRRSRRRRGAVALRNRETPDRPLDPALAQTLERTLSASGTRVRICPARVLVLAETFVPTTDPEGDVVEYSVLTPSEYHFLRRRRRVREFRLRLCSSLDRVLAPKLGGMSGRNADGVTKRVRADSDAHSVRNVPFNIVCNTPISQPTVANPRCNT